MITGKIIMNCEICTKECERTANVQKYCKDCSKEKRREYRKKFRNTKKGKKNLMKYHLKYYKKNKEIIALKHQAYSLMKKFGIKFKQVGLDVTSDGMGFYNSEVVGRGFITKRRGGGDRFKKMLVVYKTKSNTYKIQIIFVKYRREFWSEELSEIPDKIKKLLSKGYIANTRPKFTKRFIRHYGREPTEDELREYIRVKQH